ncbi:MAG: hypothetical protein V1735_06925 [Nanoarchaeota archaeon]
MAEPPRDFGRLRLEKKIERILGEKLVSLGMEVPEITFSHSGHTTDEGSDRMSMHYAYGVYHVTIGNSDGLPDSVLEALVAHNACYFAGQQRSHEDTRVVASADPLKAAMILEMFQAYGDHFASRLHIDHFGMESFRIHQTLGAKEFLKSITEQVQVALMVTDEMHQTIKEVSRSLMGRQVMGVPITPELAYALALRSLPMEVSPLAPHVMAMSTYKEQIKDNYLPEEDRTMPPVVGLLTRPFVPCFTCIREATLPWEEKMPIISHMAMLHLLYVKPAESFVRGRLVFRNSDLTSGLDLHALGKTGGLITDANEPLAKQIESEMSQVYAGLRQASKPA